MRILESLGKLLGRLVVVTFFYFLYKWIGFETTVIIALAGIFVNTNPDRES